MAKTDMSKHEKRTLKNKGRDEKKENKQTFKLDKFEIGDADKLEESLNDELIRSVKDRFDEMSKEFNKFYKIWIFFFFILIIFYSFDKISQKRDKTDFLKLQFFIDNKSINYRLLKPYYETTDNVPLVIFLHGSGERGNDNEMQLIYGANLF